MSKWHLKAPQKVLAIKSSEIRNECDLRGGLDGLVGFHEITDVTFTEPTCKKRMLPMREPLNCRMSAQGTYRFYSVYRQTILLVNGEPFGRERVNACNSFE